MSLPFYSFNASWHQHLPFLATLQDGMWSFITPNIGVFYSFWIIYRTTNGSISKFHLRASNMPFSICSLMRYSRLIVHKFYHVLVLSGHLAYSSISFPNLSIIFPNFFHIISNAVKTTTSFNCRCHWCVCTCCACGNERTWTHDAVWNIFFTIMQDADFHVGWEQLHALSSTTLNSSYQWIDNVFNKNGIHT
jgi:hypothetical protein